MKRKLKDLLGALLIGGTVLAFGPAALAYDQPAAPNQVYSQTCHGKHHFSDMMTQLVSEKIITKEQADKWQEFRQSKAAERQAQREKLKSMTKEERRAYWQKEKPKRLDEVVKAGIITQEQADQIKARWSNKCKKQ